MKLPKTGPIKPLSLGERIERWRDKMAMKIGARKRKKRIIKIWQEANANTKAKK